MRLTSCAAGLSLDINNAKRLETVVRSGPKLGLLIVNVIIIHSIKYHWLIKVSNHIGTHFTGNLKHIGS